MQRANPHISMRYNRIIAIDDLIPVGAADGEELTARRLKYADMEALQAFNTELGDEDRVRFYPHPYDAGTLGKLLNRSEKCDDLSLGLFGNAPGLHISKGKNAGKCTTQPQSHRRRIVGYFFLWYFRERVPLLGIGLLRPFQGIGLGEKLVRLLLDQAVIAGSEGVELTTLKNNHRAFALYEKCGFRYFADVEFHPGDGNAKVERAMLYEIKPGCRPMDGRVHIAPVL